MSFLSSLYLYFLSLIRGSASGDGPVESVSSEAKLDAEEDLSKDEWQAISKMLSYKEDDNMTSIHGKDLQDMIKVLVDVSVGQAAARIININQTEIACGRFEELHVKTKMFPKSVHCDVSLKFYGLSSPEGRLAQVCWLCDVLTYYFRKSL